MPDDMPYARTGTKPWVPLVLLATLVGAVLALYANALDREFIFDDHEVILAQAAPNSVADLARVFGERHIVDLPYYRPITRASLLLQKRVHGSNPQPFHVFNALLMAAVAVLAYTLLRVPSLGIERLPALLAALLFAVHPVASSVAYPIASGRETAMPALWMIAAVLAWFRDRRVLAHLAFAGALLCKEQAVVLPAVFFMADVLRQRVGGFDMLRRYAPSMALLGAYASLRVALFGGSGISPGSALGPLWSYAYALQVTLAPTAALAYEPDLQVWPDRTRLLFVAATGVAFGVAVWRLRVSRGPLLFWLGWFAIVLLPTANLLEQEAPFDERYVFLASLGVWAAFATLASARWNDARMRGATLAAGALVVGLAGWTTLDRARYFADDEAFLTQWHRTSPDSLDANVHLGRVRLDQGRVDEAERLYRKAVELRPGAAEAWVGLGRVRKDEARAFFERAVALDPQLAEAHFYLAVEQERARELEPAIAQYRAAIGLKPNLAAAYFNLANLLKRTGAPGVIEAYGLALRYDPALTGAHFNLANTLAAEGRLEEAIEHYRNALQLEPGRITIRENLARALQLQRETGTR